MPHHTFSVPLVPSDFRYPDAFHDYCAAPYDDILIPWYIFDDAEEANDWLETVREWYPTRSLIPFARDYSQGDDIACFDGADTTGNPKVHFVHCFASAGWEDRGYVESFTDWVKIAKEEHLEYLTRFPNGNIE